MTTANRRALNTPARDLTLERRWAWWTSLLVQVAVLVAGFDRSPVIGISLVMVLAVFLAPVWWPVIRTYQLAVWIVGLAVAALVWGGLLALNSTAEHQVDLHNARIYSGVLLTGIATTVVIVWARTLVPLHRVVLLYGTGLLFKVVAFGGGTWKFDYSIPVTLVVLGIAARWSNRLVSAAVILGLGGFGILNDSRSYFAFCFLAAMLTVWQVLTRRDDSGELPRSARRWAPAVLIAALGLSTYFAASALLTSGFFGSELQARSEVQVQTSGSLISGGRPEWAATRELVRMRPGGYGIGVVPLWKDVEAGRAGMASINVDAGGYVDHYMFGGAFELHSGLSDLWVSTGLVGVAFAVLVIVCLIRNLSTLLAARRADTVVIFCVTLALWSMFFGPLYTDWQSVCLALGLSMLPMSGPLDVASADR